MRSPITNYAKLVLAYLRINLNAQLEYRGAFITEAAAMLIDDCFWLGFWMLFFAKFPTLKGWTLKDVATLWAVTTAGFGIAYAVMGNAWRLAGVIVNGQLDIWMLYPRSVLLHLLPGSTVSTAWGDATFGYVVFLIFVRPDVSHLILFSVLTVSTAVAFVAFGVLTASLAFFLGNGILLAEQWRNAAISFSTYPESLFEGSVRFLLFTALPVGFTPKNASPTSTTDKSLKALTCSLYRSCRFAV